MFLELRPSVRVFATGSTKARTRLYQMGINKALPLLSDYIVQGYKLESRYDDVGVKIAARRGGWREIQLGVEYEAFLIYTESILN
nr:hypothetical protein [Dyadobacter beijingensis]